MKDNNTYYVFECGCTYPMSELKKIRTPEGGKAFGCPEHSRWGVEKYRYCSECGEKVVSKSMMGKAKEMHTECPQKKAARDKKKRRKKFYSVYLEYPCGCVKAREESVYKRINNKRGWHCDEHQTPAVKRFVYCRDCGEKTYVEMDGRAKLRCKSCEAKIEAKKQAKQTASGQKKSKTNPVKHPNYFGCPEFNICGQCIKPYFPCRVYDSIVGKKVAA